LDEVRRSLGPRGEDGRLMGRENNQLKKSTSLSEKTNRGVREREGTTAGHSKNGGRGSFKMKRQRKGGRGLRKKKLARFKRKATSQGKDIFRVYLRFGDSGRPQTRVRWLQSDRKGRRKSDRKKR